MAFFSVGDILLKIDTRATAETEYTKHHVMLVIGESVRGYPIVMHMRAEPYWALAQEELTKAKELILVHHQLPQETMDFISLVANQAWAANQFKLTKDIIEKQRTEVSPFRTDCSLESLKKLNALKTMLTETTFNPQPAQEVIMSCHQWVISVIHYACYETKTVIPEALKLPPHLAWADRLYCSAQHSPSATITGITVSPPGHQSAGVKIITKPPSPVEQVHTRSIFSFFYNEEVVALPSSVQPQSSKCVLM